MTRGFYTVVQLPYEGSMLREHRTKKEAEDQHGKDCKEVDKEYLMGAALVSMEIIKEKGDWRVNE